MTEQARKDFEESALVLAVKHFGYKAGEEPLNFVLHRHFDGRYVVDWVEGAWLGWRSAVEAKPVITIDTPDLSRVEDRIKALIEKVSHQVEPRRFMVVLPKGGSMWDGEPVEIKRSDAVAAIEAAGGSVKS